MQRAALKRRRETADDGEGADEAASAPPAAADIAEPAAAAPPGSAAAAALPELLALPIRPFECPICFDRCVLPVVPLCGVHTFCMPCLVEHCRGKASPVCPCCRAPVQKDDHKFAVHAGIQDAIWQLADADKLALAMRAGFSPMAAASQGELAANAPNQAAWAKLFGLGVPYDLQGAASMLQAAADAGHVPSAAMLAYQLCYGVGIRQNVVAAKMLLRDSATAGDALSAAVIGSLKGSQHSIAALLKLADGGSAAAGSFYSSVARVVCDRDRVLQTAANQGDVYAMLALGKRFFVSSIAGSSDRSRAVELIKKAAAAGLAAAQYFLGRDLLDAKLPDAVGCLKKSAAQQDVEGMNLLGFCFLFGSGVEQDRLSAVKWLSAAADEGSADANFTLGEASEKGYAGCPVDLAEAFRRYGLASAARIPHSKALLHKGRFLEHGRGCPRDLPSALTAYQAASAAGIAEATIAVARVTALLAIRSLEAVYKEAATAGERRAAQHSLRVVHSASLRSAPFPVAVDEVEEEEGEGWEAAAEEGGGGGVGLEDAGEDEDGEASGSGYSFDDDSGEEGDSRDDDDEEDDDENDSDDA